MTKNIVLSLLVLFFSTQMIFGADFYIPFEFDYEQSSPNDVQVKVFKCDDSSCVSGKVNQITTQAYSLSSQSCFGNLFENEMNDCMRDYRISGNKVSNNGAVIKLTGVVPNRDQHYLVTTSTSQDSYVTYHTALDFNIPFDDYAYDSLPVDLTFEKIEDAKAEIYSFSVDNVDNPQLPIQVNVAAKMDTQVCSAFAYNTEFHKPQFDNSYSDYSAKTRIDLAVYNDETGQLVAQDSVIVDIEADTCTGEHSFTWTPPQSYEDRDTQFRVTTNVVDNQVSSTLPDVQSQFVTIYPEDLTNACFVNADNLIVTNIQTPQPIPQDLVIVRGDDAYLMVDVESFKSLNQDGTNLIFNSYNIKATIDGVEFLDEIVSSNQNTYTKEITNLLPSLNQGEYDVEVTFTPVNNGCVDSNPITLTDIVTIENPIVPPTPNNVPMIMLPADISTNQDQYISVFSISDENPNTAETYCTLNSYVNAQIVNEDKDLKSRVIQRNTNSAFNVILTCYARDEIGQFSTPDSQLITFEEIVGSNVAPTINLGQDVIGFNNQIYTDNLNFKISDLDNTNDELITSCTINDSNNAQLRENGKNIQIERLTNQEFNIELRCQVQDPSGLNDIDVQNIEFVRTNQNPTITANPLIVNGLLNNDVTTQLIVSDDLGIDNVYCFFNNEIATFVDQNTLIATFTRKTNDQIDTQVLCRATDNEGATGDVYVRVLFDELTSSDNDPVLSTPSLLSGGLNAQVSGVISATDVEDGDLTNSIVCSDLTAQITTSLNNGQLIVTRNTNNEINTTITCQVEDSDFNGVIEYTNVVFDEIVTPVNNAPSVSITANPISGVEPLDVEVLITAIDIDGDNFTCEVFVNSVLTSNSCTGLNTTLFEGNYNITVVVTDDNGLSTQDSVLITVDELNLAPNATLNVDPLVQFTNQNVEIEFEVLDDKNLTSCVLTSNNQILAVYNTGDCVGTFTQNISYSTPGSYDITLAVSDGLNPLTTLTQTIQVIESLAPIGTLDISNIKGFAPLNTVVSTNAQHPQGLNITCTTTMNGALISNVCDDTISLTNLNPGLYTIEFIVVDSNGIDFVDTQVIEVYSEDDLLGNKDLGIKTRPTPLGGSIITVTIDNETISERVTRIRPTIVCNNGYVNRLRPESQLDITLNSRAGMPGVTYEFELDITDFQLNINYGETCILTVEFRDEFGTLATKTTSITFDYQEEELNGIPSVRGQEIDFRNYLNTMLQGVVFKEGPNRFSFSISNNEGDYKRISYTLTGQTINVQEGGNYVVGPYQTQQAAFTLNVPYGTPEGMHLVKVTIESDGVRESKYTYIRVGKESNLETYTIGQNELGYNLVMN